MRAGTGLLLTLATQKLPLLAAGTLTYPIWWPVYKAYWQNQKLRSQYRFVTRTLWTALLVAVSPGCLSNGLVENFHLACLIRDEKMNMMACSWLCHLVLPQATALQSMFCFNNSTLCLTQFEGLDRCCLLCAVLSADMACQQLFNRIQSLLLGVTSTRLSMLMAALDHWPGAVFGHKGFPFDTQQRTLCSFRRLLKSL